MKKLVGNSSFVRYLLSQTPYELAANEAAKKALKDFAFRFEAEGCSFAIVDPGGDNETYIVVLDGSSGYESGHNDETLAAVAYTVQSALDYWDRERFRGNSGENSELVRWFKQDLQFIIEKEPDEPWEPYKFHTDREHDFRPFTEFQLDSSPYFGRWNQIYIRIYHEGPLDKSFGTNAPLYIDLLESRENFNGVNFNEITPSDYLDRLAGQFDESPLASTLAHWYTD